MCSHTLPATKEKRREGAPSIHFSFVGGRVRLHVGSHFLFWEILNVNLTFPFAVNVILKLSNKRKGSGGGGGQGKFLQRLHHKCFLHWATIKLPDANWLVKIVVGKRKGELQSHEKRHRCGSFLLNQYRIYSIKHRGAYLIFNVSDAVFIRGRLVFQNHIS